MIIRQEKKSVDRWLMGAVLVLIILGILCVYSASSYWGADRHGNAMLFMRNHLVRVMVGLIGLVILSNTPYYRLRSWTPAFLALTLTLLMVVLFLPSFHGARSSFVMLGKRFQPSEFMKLVIILYLSAVFAKALDTERLDAKQTGIHFGMLLLTVALVFMEPDLGSAVVLFLVGFVLFVIAGVEWKILLKMSGAIALIILPGILIFPHQRDRVFSFVASIFGGGEVEHQARHSLIGLAHGGLFGVGYGEGKEKFLFLPEPFSDFILASLGEEWGFIGILAVFLALLVILWRGYRIAVRAPDCYGYLLAGGITSMILVGALINAAVVVRLLPTTGLTFPFISYGGSSLLVHLAAVGILLNISKNKGLPSKDYSYRRRQDGLSL
jgi:cell division protein FtsW